MTRRINWPWRIVFLTVVFPATVVATGLAIRHGHPELVGQLVTDQGTPIVRWIPTPENDDEQLAAMWCKSVDMPTTSAPLAVHLDQLRHSDRYTNTCQGGNDDHRR